VSSLSLSLSLSFALIFIRTAKFALFCFVCSVDFDACGHEAGLLAGDIRR
jgi:hypothetical protein